MKKITNLASYLLVIVLMVFITACPKTPTSPVVPITPVDDLAQVMASVSGIVLDETNNPIQGALVTSGTATTTTNAFGTFNFNNISLSKSNGSITATKAGFFKGVRSFITSAGKQHQVKLQLMKKGIPTIVNATAGGVVNTNGSAKITFPPNAFITSSGAAYTGNVNVYSRWIDPTAANLPFIIPGDLRGLNTNGTESILTTYGMIGAELEDLAGNTLKIAPGKTAEISLPIPASILGNAPASIPLWHFDDATARWKEDGVANKTGNNYTANVSKFSFWNVDVPGNFINLDFTLVDASSSAPLASTYTRIKMISNGGYTYGLTNGTGYVSGAVPNNQALILEVLNSCGTIIYSQPIGPFSTNSSLGNINVTIPASQIVTITGVVNNCSNMPVSNGFVIVSLPNGNSVSSITSTNGTFTITTLNCTGGAVNYFYTAYDFTTNQKSSHYSGTTFLNTINLGVVNACGTFIPQEFIEVTTGTAGPSLLSWRYNTPFDNFTLLKASPIIGTQYTLQSRSISALTNTSFSPPPVAKFISFDISANTGSLTGTLMGLKISPTNTFGMSSYQDLDLQIFTNPTVTFTQHGSTPYSYIAGSFTCTVVSGGGGSQLLTINFMQRRTN